MAYQLLIVDAGGTGSAGSGNPFKRPKYLLNRAFFLLLYWLGFLLYYAWFLISWELNKRTARGYLSLAVT